MRAVAVIPRRVHRYGRVFLNGEKKERHYVPNKDIYDSFAMKKLHKEVKEQIRQEQVKKHKKA